MRNEIEAIKDDIIKMKLDIVWVKRLGYYIAGLMTAQFATSIFGGIK